MAWFTTKKGKHVNTDWLDAEDQLKYKQIQANNLVASQLATITHNPDADNDMFKVPDSSTEIKGSYNSRKFPKPDERTKAAVKKIKAYGQPIRPIGGKTVRAEDWKPLKTDVDKYGTDHNSKALAGNTAFDGQPQKALQARVYDRTHNVMEKDYHKVDKTEVMKDIEGWKNDDGTYGTGDEAIYVAYEDGKVVALHELDPGEKWSKQGICGLRISTGDYEMVWGGEWIRPKYEKPRFEPYETSEFDSNGNDIPGKQNSYSGYKLVGTYKERVLEQDSMKVQTNKTGRDRYLFDKNETRFREKTTREVLQRSTIEWTDAKKKEVAAKLEADKVTDRTVVMLKKRGAVHPEEVESYVRNLSDIRRNDLAKKMNIGGRGEEKTQQIIQTLKDRFDKVSVEQPTKKATNINPEFKEMADKLAQYGDAKEVWRADKEGYAVGLTKAGDIFVGKPMEGWGSVNYFQNTPENRKMAESWFESGMMAKEISKTGKKESTKVKLTPQEQAKNDLITAFESKGNKVEDSYITPNNTLIALVKSGVGNYSIRQSFYQDQNNKYQGFTMVKMLNDKDASLSKAEFGDVVASIKNKNSKPARSNEPTITNKYGFEVENTDDPVVSFSDGFWEKMAELKKKGKFYDHDLYDEVRDKITEIVDEYEDLYNYDGDIGLLRDRMDDYGITDHEYWAGWHCLAEWLGLRKYTRK